MAVYIKSPPDQSGLTTAEELCRGHPKPKCYFLTTRTSLGVYRRFSDAVAVAVFIGLAVAGGDYPEKLGSFLP